MKHPMMVRKSIRNEITKFVVPDTGAQMCVAPESIIHGLGIDTNRLFPVQAKIEGASTEPIKLLGGVLLEITATLQNGEMVSTLQLVYVSKVSKCI